MPKINNEFESLDEEIDSSKSDNESSNRLFIDKEAISKIKLEDILSSDSLDFSNVGNLIKE